MSNIIFMSFKPLLITVSPCHLGLKLSINEKIAFQSQENHFLHVFHVHFKAFNHFDYTVYCKVMFKSTFTYSNFVPVVPLWHFMPCMVEFYHHAGGMRNYASVKHLLFVSF